MSTSAFPDRGHEARIVGWNEVTVPGLHFLQEDAPDEIGQAIAAWLPAVRERRAA